MCFKELIGYLCGHTSMPVTRPCPLTTLCHSNPVCTIQASRCCMAPCMCPACERNIHTRKVLILEWEHRFMHERGACACPVKFPNLIRPRVVGACNAAADPTAADATATAAVDIASASTATISTAVASTATASSSTSSVATDGGPRGSKKSKGKKSKGKRAEKEKDKNGYSNAEKNMAHAPALYQEVDYGNQNGVYVRLPSLYAAEWVNDHRKLHHEGKCNCNINSELFRGSEKYYAAIAAAQEGHPAFNEESSANGEHSHSTSDGLSSTEMVMAFMDDDDGSSTVTPGSPRVIELEFPLHWPDVQVAFRTPQGMIYYPFGTGQDAYYPYAAPVVDAQMYTFEPEGVPYLGLPIGAGPEGTVRHMAPWESCPVRVKDHSPRRHRRTQSLS